MEETQQLPARIGRALMLLVIALVLRYVPGILAPNTLPHFIGYFGSGLLLFLSLVGWWILSSRVRGLERWLPVLFLVASFGLLNYLNRKFLLSGAAYLFPIVLVSWVTWLALVRGFALGSTARRVGAFLVIVLVSAILAQLRIVGSDGQLAGKFRWAWEPSEEEMFLSERGQLVEVSHAKVTLAPITDEDWPEFRGSKRNGHRAGIQIESDWEKHPPKLLWKRRVGPGWSSYSVADGRAYTSEQHGDKEAVVCCEIATGKILWEHEHPGRWDERQGGVGPRATPTLAGDKVFAAGGTGILVALNAADGKTLWQVDVTKESEPSIKPPQWGYSSSPLVVGEKVIAYLGGGEGKGLAAYDVTTGKRLWTAGDARHSYSSPQRVTLGGVEQVLFASEKSLESFRPEDGKRLWQFDWLNPGDGANRTTQPLVIDSHDLLFQTGAGVQGTKRLHVDVKNDIWTVTQVWYQSMPRPYFNDGVIHKGHCYTFDTSYLACHEIATGKQLWKDDGKYRHGQFVLLADQDLLVLLGEDGKAALVEANHQEYNEIASFQALEGKSWALPVIWHDMLIVRNDREAACYQLKLKAK